MKKEIGGYFELEEMAGEEYYTDLYRANLGRTALLWLLQSRGYKTIYFPIYLCKSVIDACIQNNIDVRYYQLDEELNIVFENRKLEPCECIYLVSYYGQLTDEKISHYKEIYGNIIVDHTHAFFQRPLKGVDTIYSCRKYWGVSDGAYLATKVNLTGDKDHDVSAGRMKHILGRYDENAGKYYNDMLANAHGYDKMEIRKMSKLTENLLRGIDYKKCKSIRENNYAVLKQLLPSDNVFNRITPEGPFAYPYYCKKGIDLRKWLAGHKIFVPTYWKNMIDDMEDTSQEYQWAANILPLPVDQRYGEEEMNYMASMIRKWEAAAQ